MEVARCLADGKTYHIDEFLQLHPQQIERYRKELICPECLAEAYFRSPSAKGQYACFGARPHEPDCSMATTSSGTVPPECVEDVEIIQNSGDSIVLDLDYGAHSDELNPFPSRGIAPRRQDQGTRHVGPEVRRTTRLIRRLRPLLKNLIFSKAFRESPKLIEVPLREPRPVKDFFIPFNKIEERFCGRFRGYWGMVSSAEDSRDGGIWLNSGARWQFSILINPEIADDFLRRFRIDSLEDLAGCHVVVLGELRQSPQTGKLLVFADELDFISVYDDHS